VTVVDLDAARVLNDIDLPGCSLVYPSGVRGFTSLCADGTMTSVDARPGGRARTAITSKAFNDIDKDALFMNPAMVGRTAWFASFTGNIRGIDLGQYGARSRHLRSCPNRTAATPNGGRAAGRSSPPMQGRAGSMS
jgi:methylamine dehydrogenase heavy chain